MTVPANLNVLKNHRYADIFPMMDDVDFQRLIEDNKWSPYEVTCAQPHISVMFGIDG